MKKLQKCPYFIILFLSVAGMFVYGILLKTGAVSTTSTASGNDTIEVAMAVHELESRVSALINQTKEVDYSKEYKPTEYVPDSDMMDKVSSNAAPESGEEKKEDSKASDKDAEEKEAVGERNVLGEGDESFCGSNDGFYQVEDGYFTNGDTLFIGDSRVKGFALYSGLQGINVYAEKGYSVNKVFTDKFIDTVLGKLTLEEAMAADTDRYRKIYIMLGLNEMGWGNDEMFANAYYRMIDMLKYYQPNAVIYVQDIIHVTKAKGEESPLYGNDNINARNKLLQEIADNEHVVYLNVNYVFSEDEGALPPEYTSDGVHIKQQYMQQWVDFLKGHAVIASENDKAYLTDADVISAPMDTEMEDRKGTEAPAEDTSPAATEQEASEAVIPETPVTPQQDTIPAPEVPETGGGDSGWEIGQDLN